MGIVGETIKMNKFKKFLLSHIEDILILIGLLLTISATFVLNVIAGIYVTGAIFFLLGVFFTIHPIRKAGD